MADPNEWGPLFWKILHSIPENLGNNTNKILQNDEILYFKNFIRQIKTVLPCKICEKHYTEYYNKKKKDIILYNNLNIERFTLDYFIEK